MEWHFQHEIRTAITMAVSVHFTFNTGQSEYELSCVYYYSFIFSGWWFGDCTYVSLNGKYNTTLPGIDGFFWYNPEKKSYIFPNRSEMKIRRQ
jgi:hypothetical protein